MEMQKIKMKGKQKKGKTYAPGHAEYRKMLDNAYSRKSKENKGSKR
jgi:hypothetical protein